MGSRSIATQEPQANQTASDTAPTGYGTGTARPSTTAPNRARTGYGGTCAQVLVISTELEALEKLKTRQLRQLELQLERSDQAETFKRARQERGQRDIDTIFKEYLEWVQDTMTTGPQPYIKVVCVMTSGPAGS